MKSLIKIQINFSLMVLCLVLIFISFSFCEDSPGPSTTPTIEFQSPESFEFAIFSDLHRGMISGVPLSNPDKGLTYGTTYVNAHQPDFMITVGDNILGREAISCSEADEIMAHQDFKSYLENNMEVPFYLVAGNHDGFHFDEYIGDRHYSFDHKGVHIIVTSIKYQDGFLDMGWGEYDQIEFLRSELQANENRLNMIFMHNPIVPCTFEPDSCTAIKQLLQNDFSHVPIMFVQGHLHLKANVEEENVFFLTTTRMDAANEHPFYWAKVDATTVTIQLIEQDGTGSYKNPIDYASFVFRE